MTTRSALLCRFIAAAVAAGLGFTAAAADIPRYSATRITLPHAIPKDFRPAAFNANGEVVGQQVIKFWHDTDAPRVALAFRHAAGLPRQVIEDFDGGSRLGALLDINDDGLAVGYGNREPISTEEFFESGRRAMASMPDGSVLDLSALLPPDFASHAAAVNGRGQVVGNYYRDQWVGASIYRKWAPFLWSAQGGTQLPFPPQADFGYVSFGAINDLGRVAGSYNHGYYSGGRRGLILWDSASGRSARFPACGSPSAINNHDQVVGTDCHRKPFVWKPPGGRVFLPHGYGNQTTCAATDINDDGTIVGHCRGGDRPGDFHALVWVPDGEGYAVADLTSLIDPPLDLPPQRGGTLALRIDNAGRILLTTGNKAYVKDGPSYVLTPIAAGR